MFKRPRLSAGNRLVNALPILALLFLASTCSGPTQTQTETSSDAPSDSTQTGLVLPAVWNSRDLGSPIASIGVAGALGSTIAVGFEDGGLQILNFEGDRVTDKSDLGVAKLGDGHYLLLSGVPVTLFPGISQAGDMKVFIHGGQLPQPLVYDLDVATSDRLDGLCSAAPETADDGVMRLAFWTEAAPQILHSGRIVQVNEELVFLPDEPVEANRAISACLLDETGATVFSAPALAAAGLERRAHRHVVTLDNSGNFQLSSDGEASQSLSIRNGITVDMPLLPVDMAGTGDTRSGGYPGGVLVVAGQAPNGDHGLVFIDPSQVTLSPFGFSTQAP